MAFPFSKADISTLSTPIASSAPTASSSPVPLTSFAKSYIARIPTSIEDYDMVVRKTTEIFEAALSVSTRQTIPTSAEGLPTTDTVLLDPATAPELPEARLEEKLLQFLSEHCSMERVSFNSEPELVDNLRVQLCAFNNISLTDSEWERLLAQIASPNISKTAKTHMLYDGISFRTDDGTPVNIYFQDGADPSRNTFQVLHQMRGVDTRGRDTRYDVTILMNGIPRVHFELKRPGVSIQQAFAQIERYVDTSFSISKYALYDFVSIFVISNGKETRYYSNTTREACVRTAKRRRQGRQSKKDSGSATWTRTFSWKTSNNTEIGDLISFASSFCAPSSLSRILADYCTMNVKDELFVAKPYQIAGVEGIYNKVIMDFRQGRFNSPDANGYVWHATGSGKTFTSFLASKVLDKYLHLRTCFLVDRKDLDSQTIKEYNSFSKDCVSLNKKTRQMKDKLYKLDETLIVGIINKMSRIVKNALDKSSRAGNRPLPAPFWTPTVFVFDECHRTQFGSMQANIQRAFELFCEFGFTATPIMEENKHRGGVLQTTEHVFGKCLHKYSIVDAISDRNVLPYRIHMTPSKLYSQSVAQLIADGVDVDESSKVWTSNPLRIRANCEFILARHDKFTNAKGQIKVPKVRHVSSTRETASASDSDSEIVEFEFKDHFNAILATDSIPSAACYYKTISDLQSNVPTSQRKKIAMIYTSPIIEEDDSLEDDLFSTDDIKRDNVSDLNDAMQDYNRMFNTSFELNDSGFAAYYEDISDRMKRGEIDILIVVNMFLTGFDAPILNTLYLDKDLRYHTLVQAFGRTCRTCDVLKKWGEIVCFRDMEEVIEEAFKLYGGANAMAVSMVEPYGDILEDYVLAESEMLSALAEIDATSHPTISQRIGFMSLFSRAKTLRSKLTSYFSRDCDFDADIEKYGLLDAEAWCDYLSRFIGQKDYLDAVRDDDIDDDMEASVIEALPDDVVFTVEEIDKLEINTDWILSLIEQYQEDPGIESSQYPEIKEAVNRQFMSQPGRRAIAHWIDVLWTTEGVAEKDAYMRTEYEAMLTRFVDEYAVKRAALEEFMAYSISSEGVQLEGDRLSKLFPAKNPIARKKARAKKEKFAAEAQAEVDKWVQVRAVFLGAAPWEDAS